jgi:hypothetical protein
VDFGVEPVVQDTKRQTMGFGLASGPAHGLISKDLTRLVETTAVQVDNAKLLSQRLPPSGRALRGLFRKLELESTKGLVLGLVDLDARRVDFLNVGLTDVLVVLVDARDLDGVFDGVFDLNGRLRPGNEAG